MDDNVRPHRALLVDEFLESEDIRRMDWPARSSDINPTEQVWDALGRAIATRNPPPRTIQEMKTALLNQWDQLPQEMINCLISIGPEFILMDDNVRPHTALLVDEFLESEDIRRMDWPARSPDLNPTEQVWDALGRAIATRKPLREPSRK
ncbi:hypothetical protein AVEN_97331-1 [Araneus ventricosus]|uniref:Tc1-like transposase DDE domain-containing protein n=1 Tax=Araneus ventricosus TaxID=182803 RepID=A0A4Y2MY09_ARAVE|nr:hypothetical protein AVEN_97331-1 [Araneus ventricosus]